MFYVMLCVLNFVHSEYVILCLHYVLYFSLFFFFFKQKTAYEMRISDWSSDVCSSDLKLADLPAIDWRIDHVAVKEAVFPWGRFAGVDPVLSPEMKIGRASCRERVCQYV